MQLKDLYPYELDWGEIIVEGHSEKENEIILIFNCDLRTEEKVTNTIQYVVGRLCWGIKNFPPNIAVRLTLDIRGQEIILSRARKIKERILSILNKLAISNAIEIEFIM